MTPKVLPEALIEELLAAAEKATPGPWYQTGAPWFRDGTGVLAGSPDGNVAYLIADTDDFALPRDEYEGFPLGDKEDDAAFIALANPQTISALIAEVKAARASRVADRTALTDWSMLPRDLYVIDARKHDIGFDVTMCSVPMVTAPEVRYVRADLAIASPPSRVLQDEGVVAVKPLVWEQLTSPREDGPHEPIAEWEATCLAGIYCITEEGGEWWLSLATVMETIPNIGRSSDPDILRCIAQADYDARIRSAILPSTIGGSVGVSEEMVERLAAHLCDEYDVDFYPVPGAAWPEDENDDGKRDGGYIAIQPKHVQARAREIARRILSVASPSIGGSVGVSGVEAAADREWDKLCEKDDRSSPVEYPDMALITRDELRDAIAAALSPAISGEPTGWQRMQSPPTETCRDCRGTGDAGGNPSYGPCQTCGGTGKASPSIQAQER